MIKLILSYLPVFPPILPTYLLAASVNKVKWKGVSAGTAQGCCQAYDTDSVHFVPIVEVKVLYMSVG